MRLLGTILPLSEWFSLMRSAAAWAGSLNARISAAPSWFGTRPAPGSILLFDDVRESPKNQKSHLKRAAGPLRQAKGRFCTKRPNTAQAPRSGMTPSLARNNKMPAIRVRIKAAG